MNILVSETDRNSFSKKDLEYMKDVTWISEEEWLKLEETNEVVLMEVDDPETNYGFAYNCFIVE